MTKYLALYTRQDRSLERIERPIVIPPGNMRLTMRHRTHHTHITCITYNAAGERIRITPQDRARNHSTAIYIRGDRPLRVEIRCMCRWSASRQGGQHTTQTQLVQWARSEEQRHADQHDIDLQGQVHDREGFALPNCNCSICEGIRALWATLVELRCQGRKQ